MLRALSEYHVGGIKSNIGLFRAILNDPAFRAGDLDTGYLDRLLKTALDLNPQPSPELGRLAALVAARRVKAEDAPHAASSSRWLAEGRDGLLR
jgi:acetyl-CoA carboxylase biotin carboxylase subunit